MIEIIKKEFYRRIIEEGYTRIEKCMNQLSTEDIWYTPNENSNSMANLVMHLNGNVRQYIVSGIGGVRDNRQRGLEFEKSNSCLLYTSPSPRDRTRSRMPSSA